MKTLWKQIRAKVSQQTFFMLVRNLAKGNNRITRYLAAIHSTDLNIDILSDLGAQAKQYSLMLIVDL